MLLDFGRIFGRCPRVSVPNVDEDLEVGQKCMPNLVDYLNEEIHTRWTDLY